MAARISYCRGPASQKRAAMVLWLTSFPAFKVAGRDHVTSSPPIGGPAVVLAAGWTNRRARQFLGGTADTGRQKAVRQPGPSPCCLALLREASSNRKHIKFGKCPKRMRGVKGLPKFEGALYLPKIRVFDQTNFFTND